MRPIPLKKTDFYRTIDEVVPGVNFDKGGIVSPQRKIYLQKISMEGLDDMYEYSKDPLMYKYLERSKPPRSINQMEQYLNNFLNQVGSVVMGRTRMMWFVKKVDDDKIIGTVSILDIDYERQMTDWGFGLGVAHWGKGYSLEMLELTKKYIFEELCLNRIYGCTDVENKGVTNILLALGAKQEGIARQVLRDNNGKYHDGWTYSILADDYFSNTEVGLNKNDFSKKITRDTIAGIISNTLGGVSVGANEDMQSIAQWDSLNHINIIVSLQEKTGAQFTPVDISKAISVEEIYQILNYKHKQV